MDFNYDIINHNKFKLQDNQSIQVFDKGKILVFYDYGVDHTFGATSYDDVVEQWKSILGTDFPDPKLWICREKPDKSLYDFLVQNNKTEDNENKELGDYKIESDKYTIEDFDTDILGGWNYKEHFEASWDLQRAMLLTAAPGMGKSTIALRLAYLKTGFKNTYRILRLVFNESTSREDLIDGIQCINGTWQYTEGSLMKFCKLADLEPNKDFVVVIDEINRANTERVLGEAMECIANRGLKVITNRGKEFYIPENIWFIGTMNSYDQSVKSLSGALKNRFDIIDFNNYKLNITADELINKYNLTDNYAKTMSIIVDSVNTINGLLSTDEIKGKDNIIGDRIYFIKSSWNKNTFKALVNKIESQVRDKINTGGIKQYIISDINNTLDIMRAAVEQSL